MNKLIYLASPYTHDDNDVMEHRYEQACEYTAKLKRQGYYVFSPIAHSHGPAQYGLPKDYEYWSGYCELMLPKCDIMMILMIDGFEKSKGIAAEIALWRKMGKVPFYCDFDDIPVITRANDSQFEFDFK